MRIEKGREAVLRLYIDDEGGTLRPAAGTPVVSVVTSAGATLGGAEQPGAVASESLGVYTATLPARASLDILTVNWTYTPSGGAARTSSRKSIVVAGRTVPLWRYREDPELTTLPTPALLRLSDLVDEWLRDALGFPTQDEPFTAVFRPARQSMRLLVPEIRFPKSVSAVSISTKVFTIAEIADVTVVGDIGIERGITADPFLTGGPAYAWPTGPYTIAGTHGPPSEWLGEVPGDLQRAAVILARYASRGNNYPERARAIQTDGAMITFAMPGVDRPTGLPEVDNVLTRLRLATAV